jgi:hypothetical protein
MPPSRVNESTALRSIKDGRSLLQDADRESSRPQDAPAAWVTEYLRKELRAFGEFRQHPRDERGTRTFDAECADLYRQHPFYEPPDLVPMLRRLVESPDFRRATNLS